MGLLSRLTLLAIFTLRLSAQSVRFRTSLGDIDVNLLPEAAPATVQNFLNYLDRGAYSSSFIHRSVSNFVVQGGGYTFRDNQVAEIRQDPPVRNEFRLSNTRGTIAMAKLGDNPNSATNQWFFNLGNNAANLDRQNGGFTVFGRVANSASQAVIDRIAAVRTYNLGSPFDQLPLVNYNGTSNVTASNLILISAIERLPTPSISANGIATAGSYGAYRTASPGTYIEIYGNNLAPARDRIWASSDFRDNNAPTSLDGVSVTVNGQAAFVYFTNAGQINVQVPAGVPTIGQVPVVVSFNGIASGTAMIEMRVRTPGLLAPPAFKVEDRQYVAAVRPANNAYITNGRIAGIPAAPAIPGETIVLYGIGFGAVTNASVPIAGRVVAELAPLSAPVSVRIGELEARVSYAGLVPGSVGLYQLNVEVPQDAQEGDQPLRVTVDGEAIGQQLWLPVGRRTP
jgi:uncharacterized protein (TIGR03437 family)